MLPGSEKRDLFNRVALQEYVLIAAQAQQGGLRDKPGKGADAYHSCYNLSGLAAAQHSMFIDNKDTRSVLEKSWKDPQAGRSSVLVKAKNESDAEANQRMKDVFCSALAWKEDEARKIIVGNEDVNETVLNHPVYNVAMESLERMMRWSYGQEPKVGLEEIA
jgi:protein farnesyltransferase subunit beta